MLTFKEKSHQYFTGQTEYTSVTTVIELFKNKFDKDFWSTFKALEALIGKEDFTALRRHRNFKSPAFIEWACSFVDMNELIFKIEEVKRSWDDERDHSLFKGNLYHKTKEEQAYKQGFTMNPFTGKKVMTAMSKYPAGDKTSPVTDLWNLPDGYYPELMLWNDYYSIAGTADKVFIETSGNKRFIDIDDFKTNKEIKKTNNFEKMREPLEKLDDCNYNHYRVQVCTYAWMLEEFGYKVRNTSFTHFNEQYKLSYGHTRKYVVDMLNHYTNNRRC